MYSDLEELRSSEWKVSIEAASPIAKTILYVEDEAFVRQVTAEVLRSAGYRVFTANDSAAAMRVYAEHSDEVDLLLTDVILPGQNGRQLAASLRRENPELRALLVSGYADQMGFGEPEKEERLAKPFSMQTLLGKIREMLDVPDLGTSGGLLSKTGNESLSQFALEFATAGPRG